MGHTRDAIEGLLDGLWYLGRQIRHVRDGGGGLDRGEQFGRDDAGLGGAEELVVFGHQPGDVPERVLHETSVVPDVLSRRVDLVGDAGGKLADGLHLLRVAELDFHLIALVNLQPKFYERYKMEVQLRHAQKMERSEEHTSEIQSLTNLGCRLLLD